MNYQEYQRKQAKVLFRTGHIILSLITLWVSWGIYRRELSWWEVMDKGPLSGLIFMIVCYAFAIKKIQQ